MSNAGDPPSAQDVFDFWFGTLDERGNADEQHTTRWFKKDPAFDAEITARFAGLHAAVAAGQREDWLAGPESRLAYIIVLDQFSRNMFRNSPLTFAQDERALRAAVEGIDRGMDKQLRFSPRVFSYMPLMHSEALAMQERCVALFSAWRDELEPSLRERMQTNLKFAQMHRDIVARFGRFPHRNAVLGRESTPEEIEFLKQPGSSF